jgi:tRNA A-37 threonylcarbamoyl transferase component Bud32/SAM-dependent methyltransferase
LLLLLLRNIILPPLAAAQALLAPLYRPCLQGLRHFTVNRELAYWQTQREAILLAGRKGYRATLDDLGVAAETRQRLDWLTQTEAWIKIADIDQDGFFLSEFGPLAVGPCISWQEFQPRRKYRLSLVASQGRLGVRKEFRGNRIKFLNELKTLHLLAKAGCKVPAILDVDFGNLDIVVSFIKGKVLRQELADRGAAILDRQVECDPQLQQLSAEDVWHVRIKRALKVLPQAVDTGFTEALFAELQKIHQTGTVVADFKYGNIIIEKHSGAPYLIDFENAFSYPWPQGAFFRFLRDIDRELFNAHFGSEKLTYRRLRQRIKSGDLPAYRKWYAPLYIGSGLKIGRIWDIDVGSGRWRYMLHDSLPDVVGKRILDLGANNAFNGIHMLRHGAREVIGIELDADHIAQGRLVKEIYEWADNRNYNFHYFQANMADVPYLNLGDFDFVTAFCCIYYLSDEEINALISYLSTITDTLVLQCNHYANVGRRDTRTYQKARLEYAAKTLKNNGFPACKIYAPAAYKRPLVTGKKY